MFFSTQTNAGTDTLQDAETTKAELIALNQPPQDAPGRPFLGDPFMLQSYYPERSEAELAKAFRPRLCASRCSSLRRRQWHGPVLSGYGTHLVYVHDSPGI